MSSPQVSTTPKRSIVRRSIPNELRNVKEAQQMIAARLKSLPDKQNNQDAAKMPETSGKSMNRAELQRQLQENFANYQQNIHINDTVEQILNPAAEETTEIELPQANSSGLKFKKGLIPPKGYLERKSMPNNYNKNSSNTVFKIPEAPLPEPEPEPLAVSERIARVTKPIVKNSSEQHGHRINFPSNNVFYGDVAITVRIFKPADTAKIKVAEMHDDESALLDVFDSTLLNFDVRDLTLADFRYLMYWHKLNSFTKTPYKLSYRSMYGNPGTYTVNNTNLQLISLDVTDEDIEEANALNLLVPTVRDQEEFNAIKSKLTEEELYLWDKAKYVAGESVREKLDRLQNEYTADDLFTTIPNFVKTFDSYGVKEIIEVYDESFDPEQAIVYLEEKIKTIKLMINMDDEEKAKEASVLQILSDEVVKYSNELIRIKSSLDNTGEAAPLRETFEFSLSIADFFPINP